ncbi:ATP-binding protein [Nitrococcus mobilis]|uniref:YhaN AAA domain-containing protein n=1 Tax=Nitrococcus mobilis Nb-231 TaxID=314278 RepID=A4BLD8_9GAMM|nr:YhaN family protein [Nitrococcus mobilis]EAR23126.1 hypothetical protein NB231_14938 [Nitrococcus mobilis Nb-231]
MRIERLDLLRYGRFTDTSLVFPEGQSDVHIVFGPNEAGKSTSLAAFEDLLFGVPHNSPYNFIHDYASMRVGGVLQHGQASLEVRRRKGNKDTLLGPDELPLPAGESALAAFLGGADQTFFTRMFSLNHERLARGGREILEAKDEVGQTLFSAGSGVAGLHDQIAALVKEAGALWGPRRAGHRKYYQALDALDEADKELRAHTITANKWYEAKQALDAAKDAYAELEKDIESRSAEQRKLNRIRRVYRLVHKLSVFEEESASLGDVKLLPEDAGMRLETAMRGEANARSRIEELTGHLELAKTERADLVCDEAFLRRTEDIEQLHKQRIEVQKEKVDLPKRRAELEVAETRLRTLAEELGWYADDIDTVLSRLPQRAKVGAARTLLTSRGEWVSAVDSANTALDEANAELRELKRDLEDSQSALDVTMLAAAIRAARELGDIGSRIRAAEMEVEDNQAAAERALKPLRPQVAGEQALAEMPVPPRRVVQEHRDAVHSLDKEVRSCNERVRIAEKDIVQWRQAHDEMARDEDVVPSEKLAQERERRELGWTLVRRHYIEGNTVSEEEITAFSENAQALPETYENAVAAADHLADQRFENAQAAGKMAAIARQIEVQQGLLNTLHEEKEELETKKCHFDSEWAELWSEAPLEPLAPDFMLSWLDARNEVFEIIGRRERAHSQVAALQKEEADTRAPILDELAALGADTEGLKDQPLRMLLEAAAAVQQLHEKKAESRTALEARLRKLEADQDRKTAALEKAEAAWRKWEDEWKEACKALDLAATAAPGAVADQLETIEEMRSLAKDIAQLRHEHIGKIERDIESFAAAVESLLSAVATDLAASEPNAAVVALESRLDDTRRIRDQQVEKNKAIASLEKRIEEWEMTAREARDTLRELQNISGVEDIDQLKDAIVKSRRKRELGAAQAELRKTLTKEGDDLPLPDLNAECEGVDLDEIAAREQTLQTELDDLRRRLTKATEERANARQAFEAIGGDHRAAHAAAARQEALASMRDCAEKFVRVRTAATLLQWAIDRYRREKQAPLLKRAGQMFAMLTSNSFSDLRVEYDEQDRAHLAGIRPDDTTVSVDGMSDGTADQLYLALRLASIDEYLSRAHPLPFVADDLFINFDDTRAAAGFEVLAELGCKTQVLFFTHHRHLVDVARSILGQSINVVTLGEDKVATAV